MPLRIAEPDHVRRRRPARRAAAATTSRSRAHGAPAFGLGALPWDYGNYTWHTNRDTYDKIVFDDLKSNATLTAMLAYLASEDPIVDHARADRPGGRSSESRGRAAPGARHSGFLPSRPIEVAGLRPGPTDDGATIEVGRRPSPPAIAAGHRRHRRLPSPPAYSRLGSYGSSAAGWRCSPWFNRRAQVFQRRIASSLPAGRIASALS